MKILARALARLWIIVVFAAFSTPAGVAVASEGVAAREVVVTSAFSYDGPSIARIDEREMGAPEASPAQLSDMREESVSRSVEERDTSTTRVAPGVATNTASLADDAAGSYGPFHRLESPTQTPATAALQEANEEMWGATARGGLNPTVKAYQGPLPPGARGVEFTTPVRPSDVGLGRPGDIAIWRRGSPGVVDVDDDFVKIACTVVRNKQC